MTITIRNSLKTAKRIAASTLLLGGLSFSTSSQALLMNIADAPLFLGSTIIPNVFFVLDDSGSMDWEILSKPHNHHCMYDLFATSNSRNSNNCGYRITDGLGQVYSGGNDIGLLYIYPNSDNIYGTDCDEGVYKSCSFNSNQTQEWRYFSSDLNVSMYNPDSTYTPWDGPCTSTTTVCADASITSARSNPRNGQSGYSVTRNLTGSEVYNVWIDDKGYTGSRPRRGNNVNFTNTPNGEIDLWDSYVSFLFKNSSSIEVRTNVFNPTNNSMGQVTRLEATLSGNACYDILGPAENVRTIFSNDSSYTATNGPNCRTVAQAQTNFANWYQYTRKRSLMAKWAIAEVISSQPTWRFGLTVINRPSTLFVEMPASGVTVMTSHITSLLSSLFGYTWQGLGTPLQIGLDNAGKYYMGTYPGKTSPIILSCQQNFSVLMTDGYWNGGNPSSYITDIDGDGKSRTVADVARYYYVNDLSTLVNDVKPNSFDPATWQHMVTFTVAYGLSGNLEDTNGDGWPDPALTESSNWGDPYSSDAAKIDDLWHAAYNSRGKFASASSPQAFVDAIKENFRNIASRVGSISSAAQNSSTLNTNSKVFQSKFDSGNWIGDVLAYSISTTGVVAATPTWSANCLLTGGACSSPSGVNTAKDPNTRVIITRDWSHNGYQGIPFRFPTNYSALKASGILPPNMLSLLSLAPHNASTILPAEITRNQTYGTNLVNYLRGDRTQELARGGAEAFRNRIGILGDIVNSDPLFVGPPARTYPDTIESAAYSTFKSTLSTRASVIYTGANDGMLHAFNADTGNELMAYIPGANTIFKNLPGLTQTPYSHKYFVNGAPIEGDVFYSGSWKTILAGGLKNGGRGVYALNITNPATFTEANARNILLFEFTNRDDADMGYSFSDMRIVKMNNNKWALIFGNGYNNTSTTDLPSSLTGQAAVYVLFIDGSYNGTWTLNSNYKKFVLGSADLLTPNGISSVYPVDTNLDFKADLLYAADIKGNIWKIDVSSTNPNSWAVTPNATTPLFSARQTTAGDQPITAPITVTRHPTNVGYMIYFGTGKYLEQIDNNITGQTTQSFYGIWDKADGSLPLKSQLLQQQILGEYVNSYDTNGDGVNDKTFSLRNTTANEISWTTHRGWYMDLKLASSSANNGERVISRSILRNGHVVFTTMLPSSSSCDAGGTSWIMELDASSGAKLSYAPFDLNNDGKFTSADFVNIGSSGSPNFVAPGGMKSETGMSATPTVFLAPDKTKEVKIISGTDGLKSINENMNSKYLGRQNWRQLR